MAGGRSEAAELLVAEPEEPDEVGVRAETAVPHTDGELRAQAGGDQGVWHAFDDK